MTETVCFHFDWHSRIILLLSCFHDLILYLIHMGFSYLSIPGLATFHNSKLVSIWVNKTKQTFSVIIYTKKKKEEFTRPKFCFQSIKFCGSFTQTFCVAITNFWEYYISRFTILHHITLHLIKICVSYGFAQELCYKFVVSR